MISSTMIAMFSYFGKDIKRINHALKVYAYAKTICELEKIPLEKMLIIQLTAILHDIGIKESEKKHGSSSGKYQEMEGPPIAREILNQINIDNKILDRITFIIGNHHSYDKVDDIDFQILIEADLLVNIQEEAIKNETIEKIRCKYFKTKSGVKILNTIYLD